MSDKASFFPKEISKHQGNFTRLAGYPEVYWRTKGATPVPRMMNLMLGVEGPTCEPEIKVAIQKLAEDSRVLRCGMELQNTVPFYVCKNFDPQVVKFIDFSDELPISLDARLREHIVSEHSRPINIFNDPLFSANILKLAENSYLIFLLIHHLVSDHISSSLIISRLSAHLTGNNTPKPENVDFLDFMHWQFRNSKTGDADFRPRNESIFDPASNPFDDNYSPEGQPSRLESFSVCESFLIDASSAQKIFSIARTVDAMPAMAFFAIYGLALARWSQSSELIIQFVDSGRVVREIHKSIGWFSNHLILCFKASDNDISLATSRAMAEFKDAYANYDYSRTLVMNSRFLSAPRFNWLSNSFLKPNITSTKEVDTSLSPFHDAPPTNSQQKQCELSSEVKRKLKINRLPLPLLKGPSSPYAIFHPTQGGVQVSIFYDQQRWKKEDIRVLAKSIQLIAAST